MLKSQACLIAVFFIVNESGLSALPSHRFGSQKNKYCDYDGLQIKLGTTVSVPGTCMLATCLGDSISAWRCTEFDLPPECHETEIDYSKPYPECCPQTFCD